MLALALVFYLQSTLTERFAEAATSSGGRTGAFARVIESHDSAGLNDTERFPMQSVYKLPIAMAASRAASPAVEFFTNTATAR